MSALDYAVIFFWCALIVSGLAAFFWYFFQLEYWLSQRVYRAYEKAALRSLIKRRVRPDYWDMAMLSRIYAWIGIAAMAGSLLHMPNDYAYGVFLLGFSVWGIASKCWDHATRPRAIDNPYLLMWWECGRLHPPPYSVYD